MRPTDTTQRAHVHSGLRKEITMGVSTDAMDMAMVLKNLTDLYSDKILAVIREISTNGWDSHVAAGQTRPLEVFLPRSLDPSPEFVVKDYGTGLSAADLEFIYALYGRSTKRDSDTETGMLGFGCKAPLTYALSFTVSAVKDGYRTVAILTKNELGVGTIKIMEEVQTDEPNGVTVRVPVPAHDIEEFNSKAKRFFSFWRDGVLVDGKKPEPVDVDTWIDDDVATINISIPRSYIVQGNVSYPYDTPDGLPDTVAWIDMGGVDFTPSREALHFTNLTKETLATLKDYINASLSRRVSEELEKCDTFYLMMKRVEELRQSLPHNFKHPDFRKYANGFYISDPEEKKAWIIKKDLTAESETYIRSYWFTGENVSPDGTRTPTHHWVTNFPYKTVARQHRKRITELAGVPAPFIVLPDTAGIPQTGFPGVDWKDVPEFPREQRRKKDDPLPRDTTKYTIYVNGRWSNEPIYDGELPLYYSTSEQYASTLSSRYTIAVGYIQERQIDRFCRIHTQKVSDVRGFLSNKISSAIRAINKKDLEYILAPRWQREMAGEFKDLLKQIKDRKLRKLLSIQSSDRIDEIVWLNRHFPLTNLPDSWKSEFHSFVRGYGNTSEQSHELDDYPLLAATVDRYGSDRDHPEDWVLYINARYAFNKKNNTQGES